MKKILLIALLLTGCNYFEYGKLEKQAVVAGATYSLYSKPCDMEKAKGIEGVKRATHQDENKKITEGCYLEQDNVIAFAWKDGDWGMLPSKLFK